MLKLASDDGEVEAGGESGSDGLVRFGVSMDRDLLERFDRLRARLGYETRSEALRDLIRDHLTQEEWQSEEPWICGAVTVVYDHHRHAISRALTELQHAAVDLVVATLHVHLDQERCMEVLILRGAAGRVRALAEQVGALKGLVHGRVSLVAGGVMPPAAAHHHPAGGETPSAD